MIWMMTILMIMIIIMIIMIMIMMIYIDQVGHEIEAADRRGVS